MHRRFGKAAIAAVFLAILAVAAYWYWSPFLALRAMQAAAMAQDADGFNKHIDYPRLRASLKEQFAVRMADDMGGAAQANSPLAAFGKMMGATLVDKLVDTMVSPATVMRGMQSGRFGASLTPGAGAPGEKMTADAPAAAADAGDKPRWTFVRTGADMLVAFPDDATTPQDKKVQIVFERSGFADWKLTGLRLPSPAR